MPTYSLQTSLGPLDLAAFGWKRTTLRSVGSSRRPSEELHNPAGLQGDAIKAAERLALDLLAATGVAQRVEVVKTLADGSSRVDASAAATLDWRTPGRAVVESHDRGARSVAIPAIVERDGERTFSAPVRIAQTISEVLVAGDADEESIVAEVADARGVTPRTIADLAGHGVAIARAAADQARAGREPLVAVVPSALVLVA